MALNLPKITVKFQELVESFIKRSSRGIVFLIVREETANQPKASYYNDKKYLEKDIKQYTADNYNYLMDIMSFGVAELVAISIKPDTDINEALNIISNKYKTGWVGTVGVKADQEKIASWIKSQSLKGLTYKAVTAGLDNTNHEDIVELGNAEVTFKDDREIKTIEHYIPSMMAILAVCNVERGATYYICKNLKSVKPVADVDIALNSGKLILINDYDVVKIGLAINSLTTFNADDGKFEDMRYIDTIEAMHLISDDISTTYKNEYVGKCKNTIDNQMLFISEVNTFLSDLAQLEVLDKNFENKVDINVAVQRKAWESVKPEAKTWDDTKIKNLAFKRSVFLNANVKIAGNMADLDMNVNVN